MSRATHVYYEVRAMKIFGTPTPVASDIARHLQSRQFLGMTVVVCRNPLSMLSALRKQWLRLARNLQKQRASTLNAEEILRFTHTIMHMQHLQFVAHAPSDEADAHIFFVTPEELEFLPPGCLSLYVTTPPRATQLHEWIDALTADALVIDYEGNLGLDKLNLEHKKYMEQRMHAEWRDLLAYLAARGVEVPQLVMGTTIRLHVLDGALDALLSAGNDFLRRAAEFQHTLSLSQPVKDIAATQIRQFEVVMRLAHRVQSLTPGGFGSFLVKQFGDHHAESFFLRDAAPEEDWLFTEQPSDQEEITYYSMRGVAFTTEFI